MPPRQGTCKHCGGPRTSDPAINQGRGRCVPCSNAERKAGYRAAEQDPAKQAVRQAAARARYEAQRADPAWCEAERARMAAFRADHYETVRGRESAYSRSRKGKARDRRAYWQHPEAARARWAVNAAVRKGQLVRPATCQACGIAPPLQRDGKSTLQAHHRSGYAVERRLDVQWLCRPCHGKVEAAQAHEHDKPRDGTAGLADAAADL